MYLFWRDHPVFRKSHTFYLVLNEEAAKGYSLGYLQSVFSFRIILDTVQQGSHRDKLYIIIVPTDGPARNG